jgi:type IV secretion system protein VirB4
MMPWGNLSRSGTVMTKDGQVLAGFYFRPPDTDSAIDEAADQLANRVNDALKTLGSGWSSWADVMSFQAAPYPAPDQSHFPDVYSRAVDDERRSRFNAEGAHYDNDRAFLICYTPPIRQVSRLSDLFYTASDSDDTSLHSRILAGFEQTLQTIENQIGRPLGLRRMQSFSVLDNAGEEHLQDELVNYLNYCASGRVRGVMLPRHGAYLDALISCQDTWPGDLPVIGQDYVGVVSIDGFPAESTANVVSALNTLGMPYRFTQRMIYLDPVDAKKEIEKYRNQWGQKVKGFVSVLFNTVDGPVNEFALDMKKEAQSALSAAERRDVLFGYYSATIVVRHPDVYRLKAMLDEVAEVVSDCGYGARIEETNTIEAWRGGLPADVRHNIRAPLLHTLNLAHLMPLTGVWTGNATAPCPMYPQPSPPLMWGQTVGRIPFRFNLHCGTGGDIGHMLVLGPSGAGKSTWTNMIALQARRYRGMRITAFDNKFGMMATALACGGNHYDLSTASEDGAGLYCPLENLETASEIAWANDYLGLLYEFQTNGPLPQHLRGPIHRAVAQLAANPRDRSLTAFVMALQDTPARAVFSHYTSGALGATLDGRSNVVSDSDFDVFECEDLMTFGTAHAMPVLLHLFHRFERTLQENGRPALLFIAEAWTAFKHPMWALRMQSWLRRLRSKNCAVIMDTQSLSEVVKSDMLSLLNESCQRKVFLPNQQAQQRTDLAGAPGSYELYRILGLNDNQIALIQGAIEKEHYYVTGPDGARLTSLGLGPLELAVAGATSETDVGRVRALYATHGRDWLRHHLASKGIQHALAA